MKTTSSNTDVQHILNKVEDRFKSDSSGHDCWHMLRVWNMALHIAEIENHTQPIDTLVVSIAALIHDIPDYKLFKGTEKEGLKLCREWLDDCTISESQKSQILDIVQHISFKGKGVTDKSLSIEGEIVRDADRLDALGAIGIARTFAYGGIKGNPLHDPNLKIEEHQNFESYKKSKGSTINHFYEKLLLLKDRMFTDTAKEIALQRTEYMEHFLQQFYNEWDQKK